MQEIREAVADFRESGKLAVAWAETFGEFTHGNVPYYLATAFDRIYLQPSGTLGLTGVAVEQLFLHDALAKIGVAFQSAKRYEYKSAADNLTERGFTGPAREAAERLAVSIAEQITAAIAERRGKTAEDARALLDRGPFLAADALAEGLVDALGYRDEVYADVRKEAGPDAILQYVARYQRGARAGPAGPPAAEPARALRRRHLRVRPDQAGAQQPQPARRRRDGLGHGVGRAAVGACGRAGRAPCCSGSTAPAGPPSRPTRSGVRWSGLRAAGKPVVVSMSDVAASGGYYISMAADVIVAQPGTLTGSIGVIMGKPVLEERAASGLGITTDSVSVGDRGDHVRARRTRSPRRSGSGSTPGWTRSTATSPRRWPPAAGCRWTGYDEVARGRVWTGADAAQNGLVDELGGMRAAAEIARRRAGLPADAPLRSTPGSPRLTSSGRRSRANRGPPPRPRSTSVFARRLGPRVATRGLRRPVAVRTADAPRRLDHQLTERTVEPAPGPPVPPDLAGAWASWAGAVTLLTVADGRDDVGRHGQRVLPGVGGSAAGAGLADRPGRIRPSCSAGPTSRSRGSPSRCSRPGSGCWPGGSPLPGGRVPGSCSTTCRTGAARTPAR